jgi:hypothetical protein
MPQLLLKNLCLSSLCLLLLVACSPTHGLKLTKHEVVDGRQVRPIINADSSSLYKANITIYNKYYSGLILLKQTDSITSHLVFVTEVGMKMFDFKIQKGQLELVYVFEPLNKPRILNLLESDMKLLLLQHLLNKEADVYENKDFAKRVYRVTNGKYSNYYNVNAINKTVENTIVRGYLQTKEKISYAYDNQFIATHIKLKHSGFIRLQIELTNISKNM